MTKYRYDGLTDSRIAMTAEEETAFDADLLACNEAKAARIVTAEGIATQDATDKASGNQKLLDLGLSQAEVDAVTKSE
jgi:hypothetical protein